MREPGYKVMYCFDTEHGALEIVASEAKHLQNPVLEVQGLTCSESNQHRIHGEECTLGHSVLKNGKVTAHVPTVSL